MKPKAKHNIKASVPTKLLSLLLIFSMLLAAVPAMVSADEQAEGEIITRTFEFSLPATQSTDHGFIELQVEGAEGTNIQSGSPQLPEHIEKIILPYGAHDIQVEFTTTGEQTITLEDPVVPGPISKTRRDWNYPVISTILRLYDARYNEEVQKEQEITQRVNEVIYNSEESYPDEGHFSSQIGVEINNEGERVTSVIARIHPAVFENVAQGKLSCITGGSIQVSYTPPSQTLALDETYELLILSPSAYLSALQPLVQHKEDMGFITKLVCLDDIYAETYFELTEDEREQFNHDDQETIKYFIYNAIKEWDIEYVLAVGGWRTLLGFNVPSMQFPIRYSHNVDGEPGYVTEQYYTCCIAYEAGNYVFDTWDSNGNGRFAEWDFNGKDTYDPGIDVHWGRLACRNVKEVRTMVDKIINYELNTYESDWFNSMLSVTGDGFQDIGYATTLTYIWDITGIPDGRYTIKARSKLRPFGTEYGPADFVNITIDRTAPTRLSFEETDHLKIVPKTEEQETLYPGKPVSEIVVPSDGNIIGNTDFGPTVPAEAYIGEYWATMNYNATNERLHIQSKSYDPSPHNPWNGGSQTTLEITILDDEGDIVDTYSVSSDAYWEGEIEGEQAIIYSNGGDFEGPRIDDGPFPVNRVWTSNGKWYTMTDVLNEFSEGYGLAYVNGHSSCISFGDHYPGIPGGRDDGQVGGLAAINLRYGLERYQAEEGDPLFPLDQLTNGDKLPILLYSGCHSGQFDTSLVSMLHDPYNVLFGDRYGTWVPEGVAWWITRLPQGGSIATIGNAGLGSGYIGGNILQGLTGWLFPRFFYNYNGGEDEYGDPSPQLDILGQVYTQTLLDYVEYYDVINDQTERKHFEQWDLLGDPTLKIGGYDPDEEETSSLADDGNKFEYRTAEALYISTEPYFVDKDHEFFGDGINLQVTTNPLHDVSPEAFVSDGVSTFITGYTEISDEGVFDTAFAYSNGGYLWQSVPYVNADPDGAHCGIGYTGEERHAVATHYYGSGDNFDEIQMADFTDPDTWDITHWYFGGTPSSGLEFLGQQGVELNAWEGGAYAALYMVNWDANFQVPAVTSSASSSLSAFLIQDCIDPAGDVDTSDYWNYFAFTEQGPNTGYIYFLDGDSEDLDIAYYEIPGGAVFHPDVAAEDGVAYVAYEQNSMIKCLKSTNQGLSWQSMGTITNEGTDPQLVILDDGTVYCYYLDDGEIIKTISDDQGTSWSVEGGLENNPAVIDVENPYVAIEEAVVWTGYTGDGEENADIYTQVFIPTTGIMMSDIVLVGTGTVKSTITNTGTELLTYFDWEIEVEGISPLGEFFGGSALFMSLFRGRVFSGSMTTEDVIRLRTGESLDISTNAFFGIGHVMVTARVLKDEEVLAEKSEDGFLLGGRILLIYPEE